MLLDIRMPLRSGVEVVEGCAGSPPAYPIVAMTGHVDIEARDQFRWGSLRQACAPRTWCSTRARVVALLLSPSLWPRPVHADCFCGPLLPDRIHSVSLSVFLCRDVGFTGFLGKPFTVDALRRALQCTRQSPWFAVSN